VQGSHSFGGRHELEWLFGRREEVLPQRGHDLPHQLPAQTVTGGSCWGHDRHPWRPLWHPQKLPFCRDDDLGAGVPTPLGAHMGSSGYFTFPTTREVLPERGMAPRHGSASTRRGSTISMVAPIVDPRKRPVCRGNAAGSGGPAPFGGSNRREWLVALSRREKYCPNGAWPSPTITASASQGPRWRSWPLPALP
jgi:hypothetical protein